jgi:phosphoribosylformimino-5-aminoimidazole carboxamide ribonucleotide (ProFAR) isomerase
MLEMFAGFPHIQVIDLDAAMGKGANSAIIAHLAGRATVRAGGGVRTIERAQELAAQGASRVIVGTAAFSPNGVNHDFLQALTNAVGAERIILALDSKEGHIVVKGWQEATRWTAVEMISQLEPYCSGFLCTYVDKEGMMQGTDLAWFESLRRSTSHELTAAGGITTMEDIRSLTALHIDCAVGMSIYTGLLDLGELRKFNAKFL